MTQFKPLWKELFTSYLKGLCQVGSTSAAEGKLQELGEFTFCTGTVGTEGNDVSC